MPRRSSSLTVTPEVLRGHVEEIPKEANDALLEAVGVDLEGTWHEGVSNCRTEERRAISSTKRRSKQHPCERARSRDGAARERRFRQRPCEHAAEARLTVVDVASEEREERADGDARLERVWEAQLVRYLRLDVLVEPPQRGVDLAGPLLARHGVLGVDDGLVVGRDLAAARELRPRRGHALRVHLGHLRGATAVPRADHRHPTHQINRAGAPAIDRNDRPSTSHPNQPKCRGSRGTASIATTTTPCQSNALLLLNKAIARVNGVKSRRSSPCCSQRDQSGDDVLLSAGVGDADL